MPRRTSDVPREPSRSRYADAYEPVVMRRHRSSARSASNDRYADMYADRYADRYDRYGDDDRRRHKPITTRIGAGRKARIAVETGGEYATGFEGRQRLASDMIETRMRTRRSRSEDRDFTLPIRPQATTYDLVEDVSFPSADNADEDAQKPSQAKGSKFSGPINNAEISQSRWQGSAYDRGDLSAEITIASTDGKQPDTEKRQETLMKWHHLERPAMSFEEFVAAAQSVLEISEHKRRIVTRLLRDIKQRFEKPLQHGKELVPTCVSDLYVGEKNPTKDSASVIFLSLPYFGLEMYSSAQSQNLTAGSPIHPLRPLLQAHFHSIAQKRELAQAITKLPTTGNGKCLHLSQVWCLIVDNETMITCSRQSFPKLCRPAIADTDASTAEKKAQIQISYGNDRSWRIPVGEDTTWPAFLSVFGEDIASPGEDYGGEPTTTTLDMNGVSVNANQWSFLVNAAQSNSVGLGLQQQAIQPGSGASLLDKLAAAITAASKVDTTTATSSTTDPAAAGQVQTYAQEPGQRSTSAEQPKPVEIGGGAMVFEYGSKTSLSSLADDLDKVLRSNDREEERKAYKRVAASTASAITPSSGSSEASSSGDRTKLVGAAHYLFLFFFDITFDHPLAQKYWGAIEAIMKMDSRTYAAAYIDATLPKLMDAVVPPMESLVRDFSASTQDLSPLPDVFQKAFLHLVMVFTILSQTSEKRKFGHYGSTVQSHIKGLKNALNKGKREIIARLKTQGGLPDLEDFEICSQTSLLALVLNQLSQDVMHGTPDVASSYNDYFQRLDFQITEDPAPRSHQESLRFFLQEVEAILATLQSQLEVIEGFEESLQQQRSAGDDSKNEDSDLRAALGVSRQQIVLNACKARIASRIDKFKGLQQRAQDLGEWHRNEMETNKDRQENAIMVFTIVTIIFLPLSFVSSVFGMNTTDVRDMPYSQWTFWAAALPLTLIVVTAALWWAGEFEGFGSWVQKSLSRASSAGGYSRIPEPVSRGGRRQREEIDVRYAAPAPPVYMSAPPGMRSRPTYPVRTDYRSRR